MPISGTPPLSPEPVSFAPYFVFEAPFRELDHLSVFVTDHVWRPIEQSSTQTVVSLTRSDPRWHSKRSSIVIDHYIGFSVSRWFPRNNLLQLPLVRLSAARAGAQTSQLLASKILLWLCSGDGQLACASPRRHPSNHGASAQSKAVARSLVSSGRLVVSVLQKQPSLLLTYYPLHSAAVMPNHHPLGFILHILCYPFLARTRWRSNTALVTKEPL